MFPANIVEIPMSATSPVSELDLRAQLASIDRSLNESLKLRSETEKLSMEARKLQAEQEKLYAEALKLVRDRALSPITTIFAVAGGLSGLLAGVVTLYRLLHGTP